MVCVISQHPLVLQELGERLHREGFRARTYVLRSPKSARADRFALPHADLYVVDCPPSRALCETTVAGLIERHPEIPIIVTADRFTEANALPLLLLGAKGLITYQESRTRLARAIKIVAEGGYWVARTLLQRFVESTVSRTRRRHAVRASVALSRREQEVLESLLENQSNKEIASRLHISERTTKFHVSNLLSKFNVRRRADLILLHEQHFRAA